MKQMRSDDARPDAPEVRAVKTEAETTPGRSIPARLRRRVPTAQQLRRVGPGERFVEHDSSAVSLARNATARQLLVVGDLLAAATAFMLVIAVSHHDAAGPLTLLALPTIVVVCKLSGLYDRDQYLLSKTTLDEAPTLFWVATLYTLLAFIAGDSIINGHLGRDQAMALWVVLFVTLVSFRYVARAGARYLTTEERCIILGNARAAAWLDSKLRRSHRTNVVVVGRVSLHPHDVDDVGPDRLGAFGELERIVTRYSVDRVLIAPGRGDPEHEVLAAIRIAKRLGVYVSVLPRPVEVVGAAVEFDDVEGATLFGVRRHGLSRSSRFIKRSFDLVGSLTGLVILAPLMAVLAIAIKLDSRGPVFFRQPRVGRDDRPFQINKFRTMVDGSDSRRASLAGRNEAMGGLFKIQDDPRITRVGSFLRKTSLDELPQLINVVKGEMSLVGPRPLVLDEDERIEGWERYRMMVPPGVTGMWQILGSARIPMSEMVKIDYLYGANWSLWLDIKILLRTIPFMLGRHGL
jgi:exopolysaccharide biosynthesis polyprenyl glycosylphosphotransferase